MYIYYPSCNFATMHLQTAKKVKEYFEKRMPVAKCCKIDQSKLEKEDIGLLLALQEANQTLDDNIGIAFKGRIEELKGINYPGFHDPSIEIHSYVDIKNSISHESAVQFALNDEEGGLTLPENYNGLGFQNLISMYFKLIQFRDEWLHEGRIVRTDGNEEYIEPEYDKNGYETNFREAELALGNAKIKITDIYLI